MMKTMSEFFTLPDAATEDGQSGTSQIVPLVPVGGAFSSLAHISTSAVASRDVLIERNPQICAGKPVIRGTRISVSQIIELRHFLGWDMERILQAYPHLSAEQVFAALGYYDDHMREIDGYIKLEKEID
jgi:uncharacterized protein (DUF433 family)